MLMRLLIPLPAHTLSSALQGDAINEHEMGQQMFGEVQGLGIVPGVMGQWCCTRKQGPR